MAMKNPNQTELFGASVTKAVKRLTEAELEVIEEWEKATKDSSNKLAKALKTALKKGGDEFAVNYIKSAQKALIESKKHHETMVKAGGADLGKQWEAALEGFDAGHMTAEELRGAGQALIDFLGDNLPEELKTTIENAIGDADLKEASKNFEDAAKEGFDAALAGIPQNAFTKAIGLDTAVDTASKDFASKFKKVGTKVGNFISTHWRAALGMAIVVGLFSALSQVTTDIGERFGAIGVKEFGTEITHATGEFLRMGMTADDLQTTVNTLSGDFGISADAAIEMAGGIANTARALGLTSDEASKVVGILTTAAGLSVNQAQNWMKGTELMAKMAGVAPGVVMKDIAEASADVASFTKQGGENIARAAVQARKFGVSLSTVATSAKHILDFSTSISQELEASAILGRTINLQRARQLALSGDLAAASKEIARIVGGEAEWNAMNVFQREALADAVGMTTEELAKFIKLQGLSNDELRKTTDYDISKVVGEDAIGNAQMFSNTMEQAKMTTLGWLGAIVTFNGALDSSQWWLSMLILATIVFIGWILVSLAKMGVEIIVKRMLIKVNKDLTKSQEDVNKSSNQSAGAKKGLMGMKPTQMLAAAAALVIMAAAVGVMAISMQQFAEVNWREMLKGIAALAVLVGASILLGTFAAVGIEAAAGLLILAFAVGVMAVAMMGFGFATQLFLPFFQFLIDSPQIILYLWGLGWVLGQIAVPLLLFAAAVQAGMAGLFIFAGFLAVLGLVLPIVGFGIEKFAQGLSSLSGNIDEMLAFTLALVGFAGALYYLSGAFAAISMTGVSALPILAAVGTIGATLAAVSFFGSDDDAGPINEVKEQIVTLNSKIDNLAENFEKNWIPRLVQSNVDGAEKGAKSSARAVLGIGV